MKKILPNRSSAKLKCGQRRPLYIQFLPEEAVKNPRNTQKVSGSLFPWCTSAAVIISQLSAQDMTYLGSHVRDVRVTDWCRNTCLERPPGF